MNYIELKAGDVRQEGDEQRDSEVRGTKGFHSTMNLYIMSSLAERKPGKWQPVSLVGHRILRSDLCHLNFRRPVK